MPCHAGAQLAWISSFSSEQASILAMVPEATCDVAKMPETVAMLTALAHLQAYAIEPVLVAVVIDKAFARPRAVRQRAQPAGERGLRQLENAALRLHQRIEAVFGDDFLDPLPRAVEGGQGRARAPAVQPP